MQDESLHEIQLNGKQLVFLFMAATAVAVVIFLCGVMVGRGVPQRAGVASAAPDHAVVDPTAAVQQLPTPLAVASTSEAPITAGETLTYPSRLADPAPAAETLKPLAETAVFTEPAPAPRRAAPAPARAASAPTPAPVAAASKPAPALTTASTTAASAAASLAEPPGSGFVVQVAAVRTRTDAETLAKRLTAKGYPTFITTAGANFRVRVGKYGDRSEAAAIAGRLQREERVTKPWITR